MAEPKRIRVRVVHDDGRDDELKIGRPRDLIAFADEFGKAFPDMEGPTLMREFAFLAHRAADTTETLDEWLGHVDEIIRVKDEPAPPDPSAPAPPAASSEPEPEPELPPAPPEPEPVDELVGAFPRQRPGRTIRLPTPSVS